MLHSCAAEYGCFCSQNTHIQHTHSALILLKHYLKTIIHSSTCISLHSSVEGTWRNCHFSINKQLVAQHLWTRGMLVKICKDIKTGQNNKLNTPLYAKILKLVKQQAKYTIKVIITCYEKQSGESNAIQHAKISMKFPAGYIVLQVYNGALSHDISSIIYITKAPCDIQQFLK